MSADFKRRLAAYLALREERPRDFVNLPDGAEIILDPRHAAEVERHVAQEYEAKGMPGAWAEIGIAYQDPFLRLLRDPVRFATGRMAVHHRVLSNNDPSGAAAMPILAGRIVLIRHFRHPTRQWHWEIPRGAVEPGRSAADVARSELEEEIEAQIEELVPLGRVHGATALMSGAVALFLARIGSYGKPELGEGIREIRAFDVATVASMIERSEITDGITLGSFLHARLRGLL
jgi:ADP-ribose pyrophosphatase